MFLKKPERQASIAIDIKIIFILDDASGFYIWQRECYFAIPFIKDFSINQFFIKLGDLNFSINQVNRLRLYACDVLIMLITSIFDMNVSLIFSIIIKDFNAFMYFLGNRF